MNKKDTSSNNRNFVKEIFQRPKKATNRISALFDESKRPSKTKRPLKRKLPSFFRKLPPALDIGTHSVKFMQLAQTPQKGGLQIVALDEQSYSYAPATEIFDQQKEALRKLVNRNHIDKRCVIGLSSNETHIYNMTFPSMSDVELKSALTYKLTQVRPFDLNLENLNYGYLKWTDVDERIGSSKVIKLLVVCAPSKLIDKKIQLLNAVGLKPSAIEVNPIALVNLAKFTELSSATEGVCLWLNLAPQASSLIIEKNKQILFSRKLDFGSDLLDQAIARSMNIDKNKAISLRRKFGLSYWQESEKKTEPLSEEKTAERSKDEAALVYHAIISHLENLIVNIQHSFKYFSYQVTQSQMTRFDHLILTGHEAHLKKLDGFLASRLGVPVKIINPFNQFNRSKALDKLQETLVETGTDFAVCAGLAVSTKIKEAERINLLTSKYKKPYELVIDRLSKNKATKITAGVVGFLLLVTAFQLVGLYRAKARLIFFNKQLEKTKTEFSKGTASQLQLAQERSKISEKKTKLDMQLDRLEDGLRKPKDFSQVLIIVSKLIPKDLWVNELNYEEGVLNITGSTPDIKKVVELVEILKLNKEFLDASFIYSQKETEEEIYNFEVSADLGG